jgi:glycosyltransferase involved in cell wall biosynthesis
MMSGSLNRYYDVATTLLLHARMATRRPTELVVVAPGATPWDAELAGAGAVRRSALPREMPNIVAGATAGLSICRTDVGDSLAAAVPTKIAEFLATGRPVVVNAGLGDMDALIAEHRCGVIVRGTDIADADEAAARLDELLTEPGLARRCREAAETHFDLDQAVDRLLEVYAATLSSA